MSPKTNAIAALAFSVPSSHASINAQSATEFALDDAT